MSAPTCAAPRQDERIAEAKAAAATAAVLHPTLGSFGFRYRGPGGGEAPGGLPLEHPSVVEQIATAIAFLRRCTRTTLPRRGSYGLKHAAETWGEANGMSSYVSNGALIAAAAYLGFVVHPHASGPNAAIGVGRTSVRWLLESARQSIRSGEGRAR